MRCQSVFILSGVLCFYGIAVAQPPDSVEPDHAAQRTKGLALFRNQVAPLLKEKCVTCHGGDATEGKLDLTSQEMLLKGGERGPAVVVGRGDKSLLTRVISHQQEPRMPKDGERLSNTEILAITNWIDLGAPYDQPLITRVTDPLEWTQRKVSPAARELWSFQPLHRTRPPVVADPHRRTESPIDVYVMQKLTAAQLQPNPEVGRAMLIRRVSFDVIGLPPTAEDVEAFVSDEAPDAYERLLDRLLASPHYGERWARRWLDLARFAESHGFEHDSDRPTAFHYRDFVVQAFNSGMPYDQFVRWQIAGDEAAPHDRLALMATGYLAAGVHSTQITRNEVEKHRYDEMDDMLSTVGTSLLGLTIGCARCHDHKFDAIPQADYYRLLSTFTTTVRSEVDLDFDPEWYQQALAAFERSQQPYEQAVRDYESRELSEKYQAWRQTHEPRSEESPWLNPTNLTIVSQGGATFERNPDQSWKVTGANPANDVWQITFDTRLTGLRSIRLEALADAGLPQSGPGRAGNGNFALSDFIVTIRPLGGSNEITPTTVKLSSAKATFEQRGLPVAAAIDGDAGSAWAVDPEFGKNHAAVFQAAEPFGFPEGTRVTVSLKFNTNVHHSIGRPRFTVSALGDLPATTGHASISEDVSELLDRPFEQLTTSQRQQVLDWFKTRDAGWLAVENRRLEHAATAPKPRVQKVLIASEGLPAIKLNTQAEAEFLPETHFLRRGETNQKVAPAPQGFLQVLMANPDAPELFQTSPPSGWRTSYRRLSLSNWLSDREAGAGNLLARVIVNRLWQHSIGRGIVGTPSDFGTRGEAPTHPELLDWLSLELVRHGWELKPLQRQILSSSTYRQSCDVDEARLSLDRENKWIWHRPRRRLEAEVIRDAILSVSGELDERMFGSGQLDEGHRRRSLYFTIKRSQLMPSMTVFDAPDGTTPVADRPQTTIAPQALLLMNNTQVREASQRFARRLLPAATQSLDDAVRRGYLIAVSRPPTQDERQNAIQFLREQAASYDANPQAGLSRALVDFCQVLFCLNEFIYTE